MFGSDFLQPACMLIRSPSSPGQSATLPLSRMPDTVPLVLFLRRTKLALIEVHP
uniref:Uncharacterized protein n=1 Tax=Physcomitrium patens TaxID=3218 RepID=A0A2K1IZT2_PHYPA|nr:hypothetical protein PHYPA_022667 [Physcomitrium patens]